MFVTEPTVEDAARRMYEVWRPRSGVSLTWAKADDATKSQWRMLARTCLRTAGVGLAMCTCVGAEPCDEHGRVSDVGARIDFEKKWDTRVKEARS